MIKLPYINTSKYYPAIIAMYDAKSAEYNAQVAQDRDAGDKTRQFLKSAHRELWQDLIRSTKGEMAKTLYLFRDKDVQSLIARRPMQEVVLLTNRKRLSERTKKSESTIYRLIERLIDAGIIEKKINHGTQRDFELHLNREMVPISDYQNDDFNPLMEILKNTVDSTIQDTLRSICTPYCKDKNILINKIITTNVQEHEKESALPILSNSCGEQTRTFNENTEDTVTLMTPACDSPNPITPKINTSKHKGVITNAFGMPFESKNDTKINTSKEIAKQYADKLEQYRITQAERWRKYSIELVEFVISVLFKDKNIYPAEREKAYKLAERYFHKFNSSLDCERIMVVYRERVRIAERWLLNHPEFDFSNIWPAWYMNVENVKSGFVNTRKWYKDQVNFKKLQHKQRKLKTAEATITYAVNRMLEYKNESSFNYWKSYVYNKFPDRVSDFESVATAELKRVNKRQVSTNKNKRYV